MTKAIAKVEIVVKHGFSRRIFRIKVAIERTGCSVAKLVFWEINSSCCSSGPAITIVMGNAEKRASSLEGHIFEGKNNRVLCITENSNANVEIVKYSGKYCELSGRGDG